MTADGHLVIDSRALRTQAQNREAARERLVDLIGRASIAPKRRRATRPTRAAREARVETKKKRSAVKALRKSKSDE